MLISVETALIYVLLGTLLPVTTRGGISLDANMLPTAEKRGNIGNHICTKHLMGLIQFANLPWEFPPQFAVGEKKAWRSCSLLTEELSGWLHSVQVSDRIWSKVPNLCDIGSSV